MNRIVPLVSLPLLFLLLWACSSASVVHEWTNPAAELSGQRRYLVLGLAKQEGIRRSFEEMFAKAIVNKGGQAVVAYTVLPNAENVTDADLKRGAAELGTDAFLITRLVKTERHVEVEPGYVSMPVYGQWPQYYRGAWTGYVEPARVYEYDVAIIQTDLIEAASGTLLWSATCRTIASGRVESIIGDLVSELTKAMSQRGLLKPAA